MLKFCPLQYLLCSIFIVSICLFVSLFAVTAGHFAAVAQKRPHCGAIKDFPIPVLCAPVCACERKGKDYF